MVADDEYRGRPEAQDEQAELQPLGLLDPDERQTDPADQKAADALDVRHRERNGVGSRVGVALGLQGAVRVYGDDPVRLDRARARSVWVLENGDVPEQLLRVMLGRGQDDVADLDARLHRAGLHDVRPP